MISGTGYCDAQCPQDIKFIDGVANIVNWTASSNNANTGTGAYGSCCTEMDIWEANSISAAYTPHPCTGITQTRCETAAACGPSGLCDKAGCDFNSYRMGNTTFYGPGDTIDSTKPMTVVTEFITDDGTTTGTLTQIKRLYVQNGIVYQNSVSDIPGVSGNSLSDSFCTAQKTAFGDTNTFASHGGMAAMGDAWAKGMVLVVCVDTCSLHNNMLTTSQMSLWDDYAVNMLWLDSDYPTTANPSKPGVARGTCSTSSGKPAEVESQYGSASVTFSNIKTGPIGSTYSGTPGGGTGTGGSSSSSSVGSSTTKTSSTETSTTTTKTSSTATTTTTSSGGNGGTAQHWGQCGGQGWTGPTICASPYSCTYSNPYYSQCL